MKFLSEVFMALGAFRYDDAQSQLSPLCNLPGNIPPRNPPIVKQIRAPYQDPSIETDLRVEDLLSRMPMREKMAQLMQGKSCV